MAAKKGSSRVFHGAVRRSSKQRVRGERAPEEAAEGADKSRAVLADGGKGSCGGDVKFTGGESLFVKALLGVRGDPRILPRSVMPVVAMTLVLDVTGKPFVFLPIGEEWSVRAGIPGLPPFPPRGQGLWLRGLTSSNRPCSLREIEGIFLAAARTHPPLARQNPASAGLVLPVAMAGDN